MTATQQSEGGGGWEKLRILNLSEAYQLIVVWPLLWSLLKPVLTMVIRMAFLQAGHMKFETFGIFPISEQQA